MVNRYIVTVGICLLGVLMVFSCSTVGGSRSETRSIGEGGQGSGGSSGVPLYYGYGEGTSMIASLNEAKISAVKKAVEEMIGTASEAAHKQELAQSLYAAETANSYVKNESLEIISRKELGGSWQTEIMVEANLSAIERTLRDMDIFGGKLTPGSPFGSGSEGAVGSKKPDTAASSTAQTASETTDETALAPEEQEFINRYVENMTYMVYFDEASTEDPFLMESAVGMANSYLASQAVPVIDYAQIKQLKEDQQMVYEEQTGEEMSIIQWIAQKLNADVYIELDAETSGETDGNRHYGKAMITLKIFESSTGKLLGSVPYSSPRTFSQASQMDAVNNALQSSIYKAMPLAMEQAETYMKQYLARGIEYTLIVQNTADAKLMSDFRRKLKRKVNEVRTVSASAEETRYRVSLFGTIEDLEDIVFDVSESIPGLDGMNRVYFRGKSITFDTGLY